MPNQMIDIVMNVLNRTLIKSCHQKTFYSIVTFKQLQIVSEVVPVCVYMRVSVCIDLYFAITLHNKAAYTLWYQSTWKQFISHRATKTEECKERRQRKQMKVSETGRERGKGKETIKARWRMDRTTEGERQRVKHSSRVQFCTHARENTRRQSVTLVSNQVVNENKCVYSSVSICVCMWVYFCILYMQYNHVHMSAKALAEIVFDVCLCPWTDTVTSGESCTLAYSRDESHACLCGFRCVFVCVSCHNSSYIC